MSEMDTNLLFEKFTIDEIRNIEKRTRYALSFLIVSDYDHRVSPSVHFGPRPSYGPSVVRSRHD